MKVFTTFDSSWVCQLLSHVFPGEEILPGTLEESEILFETVYDQMKYIYLKKWKVAGLLSFEPFNHVHTPYNFVMCGNTEQCPVSKIVPFCMMDYCSDFGKNIPNPENISIPPKFACAFVSNPMCDDRNRFMGMLLASKLLDSYGKVYNNIEQGDLSMGTIISQYKFYICFENSSHEAYISEKPLAALNAHVIPVYYGAHMEYFNPKRVLIPKDLSDEAFIEIIEKMIAISLDEDLYKEMVSAPVFVGGRSLSPNSMESYGARIRSILEHC